MTRPSSVLVNLDREIPPAGIAQLLIRLIGVDKDKIDAAATTAGMSQQQFMRLVLVSAAEKILSEANVHVEDSGRYIDYSKKDE